MLKNIGDILSGKRLRQNRIAEYAQMEPRQRFDASGLGGTSKVAKNFSNALALTTWLIVIRIVLDSEAPYLVAVAKPLDADAMRRLSAFVAWWSVEGYQTDALGTPDFEFLVKASTAVLEVMYPRDEVAQEAVDTYRAGEQTIREGGSATAASNAVRVSVGQQRRSIDQPGDLDEWMRDHAHITGVLFGYRNTLDELFRNLQQKGSSGS